MPPKKEAPPLGSRHEQLEVVAYVPRRFAHREDRVHCFCDCGGEKLVDYRDWRSQRFSDCGCTRGQRNVKHGYYKAALYHRWRGIIFRCTNPKSPGWKNYGGRGIKMAEAWKDYAVFSADVGPMPGPGYSIDRINNDGNYEPGNVRWALPLQQMSNRRKTVCLTMNGITQSRTQWARQHGIAPAVLLRRLERGLSLQESLRPYEPDAAGACGKQNGRYVYEFKGKKRTLSEWAEKLNIKRGTLYARLVVQKMPVAKAFQQKIYKSDAVLLRINGQTKSVAEWSRALKVDRSVLRRAEHNPKKLRALHDEAIAGLSRQ